MESSEPQTAEGWFKAGTDFYYLQFNEKQALRCFTEAINLNPGYYQAYAERGNTRRALKNTQDALSDLDHSIKIHENASAYYVKARILYKSGQKEEIQKILELADELRPKDFLSYIHRAAILIDLGSTEEAVACCDKAIEFEPMMANTYYLKGTALGPSKPKEALECVERAIKLTPSVAIYYRFKACCLLALGSPQEALGCCEEAIMLNPNDSENHGFKAQALAAMGKIQEALQSYDNGIRLNPADDQNHMQKAILLLQCGDIHGAITTFKNALQADPKNAVVYYNSIGCTYADFLDPRESIQYFDQAIRLNPNDASSFINKGSTYFVMALYQQAAECYDRAIRLNSTNVDAHVYKGASLVFMKKYQEAITCFDDALSLGIKDVGIYNNKGKALSEIGRNEEAIACYDEGIQANPNDALIYLNKGELLHKLGKDQEAVEIYGKAYELIEIEYQKLIQIYGPEGFGDEVPKARTALMKKFMGLQEIITETEHIITRVDPANSTAAKLIRNFTKLKEQRGKLMSKFIESLNLSSNKKKKQPSPKELNDQIVQVEKIEKEMIVLKQDLIELQGGSQIMTRSQIQGSELLSKSEAAEKFQDMEVKNPQLYCYSKTFYWTLINLFGAYKFLGAGSVQGNIGDDSTKGRLLARGAHSLANHAGNIIIAAPFEGDLLAELDNIVDSLYVPANENNKMNIINKVLQNKLGSDFDVTLPMAKLAFAVTRVRERAVVQPKETSPMMALPTTQLFKNKIANVRDAVFDFVALNNKIVESATLGLEDAVLLLVYLCKNHVAVLSKNIPFEVQCADIIRVGGLDQVLGIGAPKRPVEDEPQSCRACNMF